jgi:hypothetical protein
MLLVYPVYMHTHLAFFVLFIPCVVDNQITIFSPKMHYIVSDILHYNYVCIYIYVLYCNIMINKIL